MNIQQVQHLIDQCAFPDTCKNPHLVETHISWVIIACKYVFKIKKPVNYGFLDFSTLNLRQYYCRREVLLNTRLTEDVYLGVIPIMQNGENFNLGQGEGEIVDYAVMMKNLNPNLHMSQMLKNNQVSKFHIRQIAQVLSHFHKNTKIIRSHRTGETLWSAFSDLTKHKDDFDLQERNTIKHCNSSMKSFIDHYKYIFDDRVRQGWIRDCHGDLHTGNIFLYTPPIIFDCIEFNDAFREIDVLNELAFITMDLEFHGRKELAQTFLEYYQKLNPCLRTEQAGTLYKYYKMYRANVRAKVNILQAIDPDNQSPEVYRDKAHDYVKLMQQYLEEVEKVADICS